jgi:hypothetical protein
VLFWPSTASADAIIHPIVVVWPLAWLAIIPVILVEAAVARRIFGWNRRRALHMAGVANLVSTLIGVPIGTCLNPLLLMRGLNPAGSLVALVAPLYFTSVLCEGFVADKFVDLYVSRRPVWRWALLANGASYLLVLAVLLVLAAAAGRASWSPS